MHGLLSQIVARVREGFRSHKTLDYEYRMKQLRSFKRMLVENEERILGALKIDLNKVHNEHEGKVGITSLLSR